MVLNKEIQPEKNTIIKLKFSEIMKANKPESESELIESELSDEEKEKIRRRR